MSQIFHQLVLSVVLLGAFALQVHPQDQPTGFISIDCGLPENSSYKEVTTGITFNSDAAFIDTGESKLLPAANHNYQPYLHVRSFPNGMRNCYRINVTSGTKYLIRASFFYGNYDGVPDKLPEFELHLGTNLWDSVRFVTALDKIVKELIHVPLRNYIHVCLVNTGSGVPFISAIELRPLPNAVYNQTHTGSLALLLRYDTRQATPNFTVYRYPDDIHDRFWYPYFGDYWTQLSTSSTNFSQSDNDYQPPLVVMSTAATPSDIADSLIISWPATDDHPEYHVNMHFAEVEKLQPNQSRQLKITCQSLNQIDETLVEFTPRYLSTISVISEGQCNHFTISKSEGFTLPPIINAIEVYVVKQFPEVDQTNQEDVGAITIIKSTYKIEKNWQGDPCAPEDYLWEGVKCSYQDSESPRIVSLDLSSSGLTGAITSSISNLTMIQTLDLSDNHLTGSIPGVLSQLPKLIYLNLDHNNLQGYIPAGFIQEKKDGSLSFLSLCGNSNLSGQSYCEKKKRGSRTPLAAVCSICLLVVLAVIWGCCCKCKSKRKEELHAHKLPDKQLDGSLPSIPAASHPMPPAQSKPPVQSKPPAQSKPSALPSLQSGSAPSRVPTRQDRGRKFTRSEINKVTSNLKNVIGQGGFGKVYLGTLEDGSRVAVKILAAGSRQGSLEFQNEITLLMRVHHKNLVSLTGYCDEPGMMALVYEYVTNGNLQQHLLPASDRTKNVLTWKQRLGIAIGSAQGLEYLHNHCEPPIIHRDLKTVNILLNDKLQAKIADFGLSKVIPETATHVSTDPKGTIGYLDPEYHTTGQLNKKSDIYSFGIVLLELITGRQAIILQRGMQAMNISEWVKNKRDSRNNLVIESIVDFRIQGTYTSSSAKRAIEIALQCVRRTAIERPEINYVLDKLKACLKSPNRSAQGHYPTRQGGFEYY